MSCAVDVVMCLVGEEDIGVGGIWIMGCEMEMAMDRELRRICMDNGLLPIAREWKTTEVC
jgi:hypothetical protein